MLSGYPPHVTQLSIAQAFQRGLEHHRAGRLAQAEAVYGQILEVVPGHPDALHLLGVIAHQVGRNDAALELVDGAIRANPARPGYHNQRGLVLHALGRLDEAIASYRTALGLRPDHAEAYGNLGNVLKQHGRLAESIDCYRRALALRPDFAEAHANLGNVLYVLGHSDAALACYARALGQVETGELRAAFAQCLRGAAFGDADAGDLRAIRSFAIRALSEPWARPADLARACIRLIMREPAIGECVARAAQAWPQRLPGPLLFGAAGLAAAIGDPLLRALLENAQACELAMERFLTMVRHAMLEALDGGSAVAQGIGGGQGDGGIAGADADALAFGCALARQCHVNDYVFATTDAEIERAARLREALAAAIARNADLPAATLAIVACYFPLSTLPGSEALLARSWPEPVAALLAQQVAEPLEEQELRESMRRLTPIDDGTSQRVRQQYEENPYPRWVRSPPIGPAQTIESHLRGLFPLVPFPPIDESRGVDILVAGCGTGQESIETARQFPQARVLAIDLSLASLAYAERKSRGLGIRNLEHAQADILRLDTIGRTFDVIACTGVLHHLADPVAGWRMLLSRLRPGGFMRIGLYSEQARGVVAAARRFIAERGYAPTAEEIRLCREDLMSANGGAGFGQLALLRDFYVTGECRDLLFHVEEHRFTLPQIRDMLAALDLRFLGFMLAPGIAMRYAQRHSADLAMTDLAGWTAFEAEFPEAFAGMYVFWVRKEA
ncbi:MAG TPA: tetratricopeptide repeat protein [Casimicrobiaceae bacterium]|nr:tetratricopeptide repeat protein [Casimicrobiaceae bacterium]